VIFSCSPRFLPGGFFFLINVKDRPSVLASPAHHHLTIECIIGNVNGVKRNRKPVLPVDIKTNGADHLEVPESMPGPVAFAAAGFRQGIHISYITGFTGQFEEETFTWIDSQPTFSTGIITGNMKFVIQPVAPPGKISTGNINAGTGFPDTCYQRSRIGSGIGQQMLANVIYMQPVGAHGYFKMQKSGRVKHAVAGFSGTGDGDVTSSADEGVVCSIVWES